MSFEVLLTLDDTYNTALDDPATPSYISLQNNLENLVMYHWGHGKMSLVMRKPVFGGSDQVRHKRGCTATEDG